MPSTAAFSVNGTAEREIRTTSRETCRFDSRWNQRRKMFSIPPPVDSGKIPSPPLHIKLGLMKNFVKVMDKTKPTFRYLLEKIPKLSEMKMKGFLVRPQFRELVGNDEFHHVLGSKEKLAWKAFERVATSFLETRGRTTTRNWWTTYSRLTEALAATCR